ncbi:piggyBac transposable element-derived protein 3-like [Centroberyx affinis]|uniref:piggyBac transposable element-derived protein 3-like n=1 Tax=Centroberyx affinis TaxID=166261 RepID=UPI003A5C6CC3
MAFKMARACAFPGCSNRVKRVSLRQRQQPTTDPPLSFHGLPLHDPGRLKLWLMALQLDLDLPVGTLRALRVCSQHFSPDDVRPNADNGETGEPLLKATAVPVPAGMKTEENVSDTEDSRSDVQIKEEDVTNEGSVSDPTSSQMKATTLLYCTVQIKKEDIYIEGNVNVPTQNHTEDPCSGDQIKDEDNHSEGSVRDPTSRYTQDTYPTLQIKLEDVCKIETLSAAGVPYSTTVKPEENGNAPTPYHTQDTCSAVQIKVEDACIKMETLSADGVPLSTPVEPEVAVICTAAKRTSKTGLSTVDALEEMQQRSDVEVEDSSDTDSEYDSEEEENFFMAVDPVYDQEDENDETPETSSSASGVPAPTPTPQPAATEPASSQPLVGIPSPHVSSDEDEGDEDFLPPAQTRKSSAATSSRRVTRSSWSASASGVSTPSPESSSESRSPSPAPAQCRRGRPRKGKPARKRPRQDTSGDDEGIWRNREELDVAPRQPKFAPKYRPGPRIDTTKSWSPLSLFKLFFSSQILKTVVNNTNSNANKRKAEGLHHRWSPLTVQEFYIFLAVIIFSGLVHVQRRADMWRKVWPYNFRFPHEHMTRDRFETIFWSLHLCDVTEDEDNQKKRGTAGYDRLFKIKPLYQQLLTACKSLFQPGREISIDERMVAHRSMNGFQQYMRDKTSKFKLFLLADAHTGYTWNFFVHQGRSTATTGEGLSYSSVMNLLDFPLLGKGYHLYVNNFYTSPTLFKSLIANDTHACGTIKQTRMGFPKTTVNDLPKEAGRGDLRWLRKDNLLFLKWKDTTEVTMCSSFHAAYSGMSVRWRGRGSKNRPVKHITVPDAVMDYRKYMGGADVSDALVQYYSVFGKKMKWYKTIFYHFVDIAIVNAYILHKALASGRGDTPLSQKQFREVLMKELVAESKHTVVPRPSPTDTCMPAYYGQTATEQRKHCVYCKKKGKKVKTPIYCTKCNVSLCLISGRNCFTDYHKR